MLLQTGAAYVSTGRINSLYRVILLGMDNVRVTIVGAKKQQVLNVLSVSVALVIQHAKRMCHVILSSVACLVIRHYIREKLLNTKMCVLTFSTAFVYSYQIFMKCESHPQISYKDSNIKFHKNPFSGSRDAPCGMTGRQA